MPTDTTTFFLAFTAVFLGVAWLLWRFEASARRLERRVETLEAETTNAKSRREEPPGAA